MSAATCRPPRGLSIMRSRQARHRWQKTGDYDPALDGPDPQGARIAVQCRVCGERRRIWHLLPFDDPGLATGCYRRGPDTWQEGDLLVRDGAFLDTFVCWLPGGLVRTWNGSVRDCEPGQLYPA